MSFAKVMELYRQLRRELVRHGGEEALSAIEGLALPTADDDELSFVRLVVWAYALLQENGRIAIRFLRDLGGLPKSTVNECVMSLRTWLTHNLSLTKDSDLQRFNAARSWLRRSCGRHVNLDAEHWQGCFRALCAELSELLERSLDACAVLDDAVDGPRNVEELRRRLQKNWDAHRFDPFVREAARQFGIDDIDVVAFRTKHLTAWRRVVELAEDGSTRRLLAQRVEIDLLGWLGSALPLTAAEVLQHVPLAPAELATLLLAVRAHAPVSRVQLVSVLEGLAVQLSAPVVTNGPSADPVATPR